MINVKTCVILQPLLVILEVSKYDALLQGSTGMCASCKRYLGERVRIKSRSQSRCAQSYYY